MELSAVQVLLQPALRRTRTKASVVLSKAEELDCPAGERDESHVDLFAGVELEDLPLRSALRARAGLALFGRKMLAAVHAASDAFEMLCRWCRNCDCPSERC